MALITRAQLIEALGGDQAAAQLLDPNRTGDVDNSMLDASIADAEGDIEAAYGVGYANVSSNPSQKLQRICKQLAVYYAWGRGSRNVAMPENVKQFYGNARLDLERIEARESGPGGNPVSRFPTAIDNSDGGRRAVYSVWRRAGILGAR